MKTWALRIAITLLGLLTLVILGLAVLTQTGTGRQWTEDALTSYARDHYHIDIAYDKLIGTQEGSGFRIGVRGLSLKQNDKTDVPPLTLDELDFELNTLAVWRSDIKANLRIKGLKLDLLLRDQDLRLPALGRGFAADTIKEWIDKAQEEDEGPSTLKKIAWEDITLSLRYGMGDRFETFEAKTQGTWSEQDTLKTLDLSSGELDLAYLLTTARAFLANSKDPDWKNLLSASTRLKQGLLAHIDLHCETLGNCTGEIPLRNFASQGEKWIPGLEGFDADLTFEKNQIKISTLKDQFRLHYPYVSPQPIEVTLQKSAPTITIHPDNYLIDLPSTALKLDDIATFTSTHIAIPRVHPQATKLAITVEGKRAKLMTVFQRLPAELIGDGVKTWLTSNFSAGDVGDFHVKVEGTLPQTPLVQVKADFKNATLRFLDGWPLLTQCQGQFQMHGLEMNIPVKSCVSENVRADEGHVRIHGIEEDKPQIDIKVRATSTVPNAFRYLAHSPMKSLGEAFLAVPVLGREQTTTLDIKAPLSHGETGQSTIEGQSVLKDVSIDMKNGVYQGKSPEIRLSFDKEGLKDLKGEVLNSVDHSLVTLKRDEKADYILGTIEPKNPGPSALKGHVHLIPAASPTLVTAQLSGYKIKGTQSPISFDSLRWQLGEPSSLAIKGRAIVDDFGAITKAVGLDDKFRGGHGEMEFDLFLADLKSTLGARAIDGTLKLHMQEGEVSQLPRAAVSLVDFANLKALGIKSESLSYQSMKGVIVFDRGLLSVKKSEIRMGIVDVELEGTINYRAQDLNLTLQIIPNLGAPAAALLIGIWNPLVGLALFGASQFTEKSKDSPLNRIASQTYKIDGPIDDSKIHLIRPLNFKNIWPD